MDKKDWKETLRPEKEEDEESFYDFIASFL